MAGRDTDLMLAATNLLRPGPTRVGALGRLALPRSVALRSLAAWVVGGLLGLLVGAVVRAVTGGVEPLAAGLAGGAALAHLAVTIEPVPGEHLLSWLRLTSRDRQQRVATNGRRNRVVLLPADQRPPSGAGEVARAAGWVAWAVPSGRSVEPGALVAIGVCPLDEVIVGPVQIVSGIVDVAAGSVDDRGVPVAAKRPVSRRRRRARPARP